MFKKLLFFDLDNTLSRGTDAPIEQSVLDYLYKFEDRGWGVVICSGRPHYYLYGLLRQLSFKTQMLIGENGLTIQVGKELPSADYHHLQVAEEVLDTIDEVRSAVRSKLRSGEWSSADVWIEPNESAVSLFFGKSETGKALLGEFLASRRAQIEGQVDLIEHDNCFDVLPKGYHKGVGINFLMDRLGVARQDTIAVGDGPNDQEMFDSVGYAISLTPGEHNGIDFETDDIMKALQHIEEMN